MAGKRKLVAWAVLTAAGAAVGTMRATAATVTWDGGAAGNGASWGTAANWGGDSVPAEGDNVNFILTDHTGGGSSTSTSGSNVVVLQNGNSAIQIGQVVTGLSLPGGTTITGIAADSRTLTLSASAPGTSTGNLTVLNVGGLAGGQTITLDANRTVATLNLSHSTAFTIGTATENAGGRYSLNLTNLTRSSSTATTINANVNLVTAVGGRAFFRDTSSSNGTTTFTGVVSSDHSLVFLKGGPSTGTVVLNGANTFTGSVLAESGTVTFGGTNVYTGNTTASGGTINLNFSSGSAPNADIIDSDSALVLGGIRGGGTLSVTGKVGQLVSQSFASTTINAGTSVFSIANGGTGITRTLVNLGAISHTTGGLASFAQPTGTGNSTVAANNGYATTTANDASGILGAWATIGTDWARNDGTNIVAYTAYSDLAGAGPTLTSSTTSNVRITSGSSGNIVQSEGTTTINTLRSADTAARIVSVGSGNVLRLNGVLASGTNGLTIGASGDAGTLTAGLTDNTVGELILHNTTALTVNSVVTNNGTGAVALVKAGGGNATLSAANTYTGGTYVTAGTLALATGTGSLDSTSPVVVTGGTLNLGTNTVALSGGLTIANGTISTGTINKTGGTIDARSGTISAVITGTTGITKTGSGQLTFSNTTSNTFTGDTVIEEGVVVGSASSGNTLININGHLIVGSPTGGAAASFSSGTNTRNVNVARNITVYSNGSVNLGNADQTFTGTINILGGSFSLGQFYGSTTVNMTGGTITGGFFGNTKTFNITGDTTATIGASGGIGAIFNVGNGASEVDALWTSGISVGNHNITKNGVGLLSLTGNSTTTGVVNVSAGTLRVAKLSDGVAATASTSGSTSQGSTTLTLNTVAGLSIGQSIYGSGISGSTITNISGNTITISGAVTSNPLSSGSQFWFGSAGLSSSLGIGLPTASNLLIGNGATLQYVGTGHSTNRLFTINGSSNGHGATLDASGTGAAVFNGLGNVAYGSNNQTRTLTLTGTSTANNTLGLTINNNGTAATSVSKTGTGKWILSGTNGYTGATNVTAGTLLVTGLLGASDVTINGPTAVFGGTGIVGGNVTVTSGKLSPGNAGVGDLILNGNVTINDTLAIDLDGATGDADKLLVNGLGKTLDISNAKVAFNVLTPLDDEFYIFASYTALSGTFLPGNIIGLTPHQHIEYNYLGGNQMAVVPEPATTGWLLVGIGAALTRRRRRGACFKSDSRSSNEAS